MIAVRYIQATLLLSFVALALYCTARSAAPTSVQPLSQPITQAPAIEVPPSDSSAESNVIPVEPPPHKDLEPTEYTWAADLSGDIRVDQLRTVSGDIPITFDEQRSNRMALDSFLALRFGVVQCNTSGKVFLLGKYDSSGQSFALDHWSIDLPFTISIPEDDSIRDHHVMRIGIRHRLLREDFRVTATFDPNGRSFSPKRHERSPETTPPKARPN